MPKGSEPGPKDIVRLHREAFCQAFLIPRVRDRKMLKPDELADEFYHNLPSMLRANRRVALTPPVLTSNLIRLIQKLSKETKAVYLGHSMDEWPCELAEVVDAISRDHGAVASIEAGTLAIYATEGCPRPDWYLLCSDPGC